MAQREDVWFTSGDDRVSAWLYRPSGTEKAPLVVMAHGLGAVRTMQLDDWAAAVAYARTLRGIDHDRIAVWGTSFGGGHAIATAARLPGIAAAVAQCPFTDAVASLRAM